MTERRATYRFGPLERRGLLGPVRAGQAALIGAGAVIAMTLLDAAPSFGSAFGGALLMAGAIALGTVPLRGRTADQWAPVAGMYCARRVSGGLRFRSRLPLTGRRGTAGGPPTGPSAAARRRPAQATPEPPPSVRDVTIRTLDYRDRQIGVLSERRGRRLTAVLACRVVSFALLDPEAQERRLARWGLVLAGAAGTPVRRIQWLERTVPAQGDELARWLHHERDPSMPPRGTPMIESYLELISTTAQITQEHELLVAVQVDARRVRERGRDACSRALIEATERVAERLGAAEIDVVGALGPPQLNRVMRTAFDPFARTELTAMEAADPSRPGLEDTSAWPLGAEERWDSYRSDGAEHATYWIGAWPRMEVSPMFMDALLGRSSVVRTVAVTFEPIPPDRSAREVEAAITRDRADRELRRRFGQSETARQLQAQEATARREAELAAGHCEVRLSGFVTVSGRDRDDLRRSCAEVLDHAARARLELHRMYGQQADAFTFTLPLCRGLK